MEKEEALSIIEEIRKLADPIVRLPKPSRKLIKYLELKKGLIYHQTPPITAHQIAAIDDDETLLKPSVQTRSQVPKGDNFQCSHLPQAAQNPEKDEDLCQILYSPESGIQQGSLKQQIVSWYLLEAKNILREQIQAIGDPFYQLNQMLLRTLQKCRHDVQVAFDFIREHKDKYFTCFGHDIVERKLKALQGVESLYPPDQDT